MKKNTHIFILLFSFLLVANTLFAEVDKSKYFHIINNNASGRTLAVKFVLSVAGYRPNYSVDELDFYYSTDCENWTKFPAPTITSETPYSVTIAPNETIYIKGYHPQGLGNTEGTGSWQLYTGPNSWSGFNYEVAGDIMSLVKGDFVDYGNGTTNYDTIPADYCFYRLFANASVYDYIKTSPNLHLSAKVLKKGCYKNMFENCRRSDFTATPSLATVMELAPECCMEMFKGCTYMTTITDFPQVEVIPHSAYRSMFESCVNCLATVPNMEGLREIDDYGCYQMFYNCRTVTTINLSWNLRRIGKYGAYCMFHATDYWNNLLTESFPISADVVEEYGCEYMFYGNLKLNIYKPIRARRVDKYGFGYMFWRTGNWDYTADVNARVESVKIDTVGNHGCYEMFLGLWNYDRDARQNVRTIQELDIKVVGDSGCMRMFRDCQRLTSIPEIHITKVGKSGCEHMFYECINVTNMGAFTTDSIGWRGCYQAFMNSYTLENIGELHFGEVGDYGCYQMFYQNTKLKTLSANALHFDNIGEYGCFQMFMNCTDKLEVVPEMIVGNVGKQGCMQMFYQCYQVCKIKKIVAHKVDYQGMYEMYRLACRGNFYGTLDSMRVDTLMDQACYQFFYDGMNLQKFYSFKAGYVGREACYNMFVSCALNEANLVEAKKVRYYGMFQMFYNNDALVTGPAIDIVSADTCALRHMFEHSQYMTSIPYLRIDTAGYECVWCMFGENSRAQVTSIGSRPLKFHVVKDYGLELLFYYQPIASLPDISADTMGVWATYRMLEGCGNLKTINNITVDVAKRQAFQSFCESHGAITSVGDVSIRHVGWHGCFQMFYNCQGITSIGKVTIGDPNHIDECQIEGAGCQSMFHTCTQLNFVEAPTLAVHRIADSACYAMFYNCPKLTLTPTEIPATYIGRRGCQEMFRLCPLLATTPTRIRASYIGEYGCHYMFNNLKNITSAPLMDVVTIDSCGCSYMFSGCTGLTSPARMPNLKTIKGYGCEYTYSGCTFTKIPSMVIDSIGQYGCHRMYEYCSGLKVTPNLSSHHVGKYGCYFMFRDCYALDTVYNLHAHTIRDYGCQQMYYNCTSLDSVGRLIADSIGYRGCYQMFIYCYPLHYISKLEARVLGNQAWQEMLYQCFRNDYIPNYATIGATIDTIKVNKMGWQAAMDFCRNNNCSNRCGLTSINVMDIQQIGDSACWYMFYDCNALTHLPKEIPATQIGNCGCYATFYHCDAIPTASDMPYLTKVGNRGCQSMYQNCGLLVDAPRHLPATTIGEWAYYAMFYQDSKLENAPEELPVTDVPYAAYYQMFESCNKLKTIPLIKAVNVADYGCWQMFIYNHALTDIAIPYVEHVGKWGMQNMFYECAGLLTANLPELQYIDSIGCSQMFRNSNSLRSMMMPKVEHIGGYGCDLMCYDCDYLDTISAFNTSYIGMYGCSRMFENCYRLHHIPDMSLGYVRLYGCQRMFYNSLNTHAEPYNSRCGFIRASTIEDHGLYWFCNACNNKITSIAGFEADSVGNYGCLEMFRYSYQLDTILSNEIVCNHPGPEAFHYAFANCSKLRTTPNLPAERLVTGSYRYMFYDCDALVTPPIIGAKYVGEASCHQMFYDCDALKTAPQLFAKKMGTSCYQQMFAYCDKLTTACELPATELAPYCYSEMFRDCPSLTHAPLELPATKAAERCYNVMFYNCTNVGFTRAPEIKLEKVAPYCCSEMFYRCTNLTDITSELPATSVANYCYYRMFRDCPKITIAPTIYAQNCRDTLGNYVGAAFCEMFYSCTALREIKTYQSEWYGNNNDNWVGNVSTTGDFYCVKNLPREYSFHRIPYNTTYPWNIHILTRMQFDVNGGTWDGTNTDLKSFAPPLNGMPVPMKENSMFVRWDTLANGQGNFALNWRHPLEGDYTYYAVYTPVSQFSDYAWRDTALVIRTTRTDITTFTTNLQNDSVEKINTSCRLPGQVNEYLLAYDSASLQRNLGKLMNIMLKNAGGDTLGYVTIRVPYIIKDNVRSSSLVATDNADVWVTNGGVFTVDDVRKVRTLYVTGGGKAVVPEGRTLRTDNIVLSAGRLQLDGTYDFAYPQLVVNGSIINASGKVNYDHLTSTTQYYSLCLPYTVNLGDVLQENGKYAVTPKKNSSYIAVEYYDGETRLKGGSTTGWKKYFDPTIANSEPYKDLKAGVGYTFYGRGPQYTLEGSSTKYRNAYATFRFPMAIDLTHGEPAAGDSKTIHVTPWGFENGEKVDSLKVNDVGWNLVGNPFLADVTIRGGLSETNGIGMLDSIHNAEGEWTGGFRWLGNLRYVVIPNNTGTEYTCERVDEVTLPAFRNFFIQIGSGDMLSVQLKNRAQRAPAFYTESETDEIMAGITLSGQGKKDRLGLLISNDYSNAYEINADVDKWMNTGLNLYANVGNYRLTVAAVDDAQAVRSIPVTVSAPSSGTYTFALDESWTPQKDLMNHLYLYDSEEGVVTDLLQTPYECVVSKGTNSTRFCLVAQRREHLDTPTTLEDLPFRQPLISAADGMLCIRGLSDAQVSVYSMVGQCLFNGTQTGELTISAPRGVYLIRINQDGQTITNQYVLQ